GRLALVALGVEREVDHHDRVLLDDADQENDADDRDDGEVLPRCHQREQRTDAGRRQCRENRQWMDEALIEYAKHDVDGDDRGQDQKELVRQRRLEGERRTLEIRDDAERLADLDLRLLDRGDRLAERGARREVERDRRRRKLSEMRNLQRRGLLPHLRQDRERHRRRADRGGQVDVPQRLQRVLQRRIGLQDHALLVGVGEDGRDDALTVGIVERIVDGGRRDAEARCLVAVDLDEDRQALCREVGRDIAELRQRSELVDQFGRPFRELYGIGVLEDELVLRLGDGAFDGQVLHRLHVERDAGQVAGGVLEP